MYENGNKMRLIVLFALLVAALLMLAAPAMADEPASSFVISGWVSRADGDPCNDPWVQITNLNSSVGWDAENSSDSNYYQLVLDSDDVNAGEILRFGASGCSQAKIAEHTVTQGEIGGGFELNITLEPIIISCDSSGAEKNEFAPNETVYVKGSGLSVNTNYTLWIQDDPVCEGYVLCAANATYGDGANVTVQTGADGSFEPTLLWDIPSDATPTHHEYDIVADKQDDGTNTSKYNTASDGIDSASVAGIIAPVPELSSIALFAVGLVMLIGLVRFRRGE